MEIRDWVVIILWMYFFNGAALSWFIINYISGAKAVKQAVIKKFAWFFFVPGMCFVIIVVTMLAGFFGALKEKIWEV